MLWSRTLLPGRTTAVLLFLLVAAFVTARAHPPLPASVLDPRTIPEAWNVLRLSTANIEQLLRENRLAEIPDQASLCSPALRAIARLAPPAQRTAIAERTVRAETVVSTVAQSGTAGDRATAASAFAVLQADMHALAASFDPSAVGAEIYFCPMHPDFLNPDPAARCARCGMALQPRRIPYSFVYATPGEPTLHLALTVDPPLAADRASRVTLHLTQRGGSPVLESDLLMMHTRPIHLLIVDTALEDYHHEHPVPTATPGEYTFSFTPSREASYQVFADLVPLATGVQEFPFADLPGALMPVSAKTGPSHGADDTSVSVAGGLRFTLGNDESDGAPLHARRIYNVHVTVSEPDGRPVTRLEPVMNAFAHLVGFYDDRRTVLHLHPEGGEIVNPDVRGGPSLDFRFYAPKPGFVRLFCQVQIGGEAVYAPFNINVQP